jgi:hypothetical protein
MLLKIMDLDLPDVASDDFRGVPPRDLVIAPKSLQCLLFEIHPANDFKIASVEEPMGEPPTSAKELQDAESSASIAPSGAAIIFVFAQVPASLIR